MQLVPSVPHSMSTPASPTKTKPRMSPMPPLFVPKKLRGVEEVNNVHDSDLSKNMSIYRVQSTSALRIPKQRSSFWRRYDTSFGKLCLGIFISTTGKFHIITIFIQLEGPRSAIGRATDS